MPELLITPEELDKLVRWPRGRAQRLARRGKLPCRFLPDGAVRFVLAEVEQLIRTQVATAKPDRRERQAVPS